MGEEAEGIGELIGRVEAVTIPVERLRISYRCRRNQRIDGCESAVRRVVVPSLGEFES